MVTSDASKIAVQYDVSLEDYRAMSAHLCSPAQLKAAPERWIKWALMGGIVIWATSAGRAALPVLIGMALALIGAAAYFVAIRARAQALFVPRPNGYILCHYDIELTERGISTATPYWTGETRWSGVLRVDDTPGYVYLVFDPVAAYGIPKAAFADPQAAEKFVAFARERASAAQSERTVG
jgi:YcxB-like protein